MRRPEEEVTLEVEKGGASTAREGEGRERREGEGGGEGRRRGGPWGVQEAKERCYFLPGRCFQVL